MTQMIRVMGQDLYIKDVSVVATFLWLCFSLRNLKCFRQESSLDSLMSKIKSKDNG